MRYLWGTSARPTAIHALEAPSLQGYSSNILHMGEALDKELLPIRLHVNLVLDFRRFPMA